MLRQLPRTLVARYAPPLLKRALRGTWRQIRQLRGRQGPPRLLFVFGGRSDYWPGAGQELYARELVFRQTVEECERLLTQVLGGPSIRAAFTGPSTPAFVANEAQVMHRSLVMQLALVALWRAAGVQPTAMLGISLGEVAAVYAAGGLSLTDALRVNCCYAAVSQLEPPDYQVLVLTADIAVARHRAAECPVELFVVLLLDATSCLAFCTASHTAAVMQYLAAHGVASQPLRTALIWPYHTQRLAQHQAALQLPLRGLEPRPLAVPCYLATEGRLVPAGTVLGPDYWLALLHYPVKLNDALGAVRAAGYDLLLPVGSNPLPFFVGDAQQRALSTARLLPAMHADLPEWATLDANRRELAGLVPAHRLPPSVPALAAAEFITQFSWASPEVIARPAPSLAYLRRQGAKLQYLAAEGVWLVLDTELINRVLREPLLFSSIASAEFDNALVGADPPIHTANRALFQPAFAPSELAALGGFTATMVAELAAAMQSRPAFDFVADFAVPLTQAVSAQMLGLTTAERKQLQSCLPGHAYSLGYLGELDSFFEAYFQQPRLSAGPGLLGLLHTHLQTGRLTPADALSLTKTLWLAGIATSSMLLSSAAQYLLTHPGVAAQLRAQPELVDAFVEEILRLEPPLNTLCRIATQPVTLDGQELPAGASIICALAAANRDPARYPHPDELDLGRRPTRHFSFGGGIHACLGAHLARLEARVVVHWLLAQGAALRLTQPDALPEYFNTPTFRALATLPVTLQPRASA